MEIKLINISEIKNNPTNPRLIKDHKYQSLLKSIKDLPEMLHIRPIVVNKDMMVLGGNMRLKACKEAGITKIPVIVATNLSEEQEKEFLIKDNISAGEFDYDILKYEWSEISLNDYGLELEIKAEFYEPLISPNTQYSDVTQKQLDDKSMSLSNDYLNKSNAYNYIDAICPHCFKEFKIDKVR